MPNTEPMTQRVELATVMDRLAVDGLVTDYAVAVDDGDWKAYRGLFTPGGRADYRSAGGIEGDVGKVAAWLEESMRPFAMRQHLIVNRRVRFGILEQDTGDTARVQADYVNPMRFAGDGDPDRDPVGDGAHDGDGDSAGAGVGAGARSSAPDFVCGGRYAFGLVRTDDGWRLCEVVVQEKWRRLPGRITPVLID